MAYLNGSGLAHYDEKIKEYIGSHGGSAVGSQITGYGSAVEPNGGFAVMDSTGGPVAAMSTGSFYQNVAMYVGSMLSGGDIAGFQAYGGSTVPYVGVATGSNGPVYMMSGSAFIDYVGSQITPPAPKGSQITGYSSYGQTSLESYYNVAISQTTGLELQQMRVEYFGSAISQYIDPSGLVSVITGDGTAMATLGSVVMNNGNYGSQIAQMFGDDTDSAAVLSQDIAQYIGSQISGSSITGFSGVSTTGDVAKVGVFTHTGSPLYEVPFDTFRNKMESEMGAHIETITMTATGGDQVVFIHSGSLYSMDVSGFLNIQ